MWTKADKKERGFRLSAYVDVHDVALSLSRLQKLAALYQLTVFECESIVVCMLLTAVPYVGYCSIGIRGP